MTAIAAPVMARLQAGWEQELDGRRQLRLGEFVALVAPAGTPWLPNAIVLDPGPTVVWDPVLPALAAGPALERRARAVLAALRPAVVDGALAPPHAAIEALQDGDLDAAVDGLLGRGGGLTPEGDDLLAGAFAVRVAGGLPVVLPPDLRERTTALSATLLELAAAGAAARPLHAVLDVREERWLAALRDLEALGSSSGRAIALGAASALLEVSVGVRPSAARH